MDRHFIVEPKRTNEELEQFAEAWLNKYYAQKGTIKSVPSRPQALMEPVTENPKLVTNSVEERLDNYIGLRYKKRVPNPYFFYRSDAEIGPILDSWDKVSPEVKDNPIEVKKLFEQIENILKNRKYVMIPTRYSDFLHGAYDSIKDNFNVANWFAEDKATLVARAFEDAKQGDSLDEKKLRENLRAANIMIGDPVLHAAYRDVQSQTNYNSIPFSDLERALQRENTGGDGEMRTVTDTFGYKQVVFPTYSDNTEEKLKYLAGFEQSKTRTQELSKIYRATLMGYEEYARDFKRLEESLNGGKVKTNELLLEYKHKYNLGSAGYNGIKSEMLARMNDYVRKLRVLKDESDGELAQMLSPNAFMTTRNINAPLPPDRLRTLLQNYKNQNPNEDQTEIDHLLTLSDEQLSLKGSFKNLVTTRNIPLFSAIYLDGNNIVSSGYDEQVLKNPDGMDRFMHDYLNFELNENLAKNSIENLRQVFAYSKGAAYNNFKNEFLRERTFENADYSNIAWTNKQHATGPLTLDDVHKEFSDFFSQLSRMKYETGGLNKPWEFLFGHESRLTLDVNWALEQFRTKMSSYRAGTDNPAIQQKIDELMNDPILNANILTPIMVYKPEQIPSLIVQAQKQQAVQDVNTIDRDQEKAVPIPQDTDQEMERTDLTNDPSSGENLIPDDKVTYPKPIGPEEGWWRWIRRKYEEGKKTKEDPKKEDVYPYPIGPENKPPPGWLDWFKKQVAGAEQVTYPFPIGPDPEDRVTYPNPIGPELAPLLYFLFKQTNWQDDAEYSKPYSGEGRHMAHRTLIEHKPSPLKDLHLIEANEHPSAIMDKMNHNVKGLHHNHEQIMGQYHRLHRNKPSIRHHERVLGAMEKIPPHENLDMSYRKAAGCGICGGARDLMVHSQDPADVTCKKCVGMGMTSKRYDTSEVELKDMKDSPEHKELYRNHEHNKLYDSLKGNMHENYWHTFNSPVKSKFEKLWSRHYVMHRPYDESDYPKLVHGLGRYLYDNDNVNSQYRDNLNSVAVKYLHHADPHTRLPKEFFPLQKNNYEQLHALIKEKPQLLKTLLIND